MTRTLSALALALVLWAAPAQAIVTPDEILPDPALEARARAISRQVRCVVCQNQSIDDSAADLARDMRRIVRERLLAGDSDQAVLAFLVERYGDFVLLDPPFGPKTYALWFGPWIVLALGSMVALLWLRSREAQKVPAVPPLSAAELARLDKLIEEFDARESPKAGERKS